MLSVSSCVLLDHLLNVLRVVRLDLKRIGARSKTRCTQDTEDISGCGRLTLVTIPGTHRLLQKARHEAQSTRLWT